MTPNFILTICTLGLAAAAAAWVGAAPREPEALGVDYCDLPNAEAQMGCTPERLEPDELARCDAAARLQATRILAGMPEVCKHPGAPRRIPRDVE